MDTQAVIQDTRQWLEKIVLGLNLCPFARQPYQAGLVRFVVSQATHDDQLLDDLLGELQRLHTSPPSNIETTLLIHPWVLTSFEDYNQFLDVVDTAIQASGLEGVIQAASFHPDYRFADTEADSPENWSNRSPYPMLHLLREQSIASVIQDQAQADQIVARNVAKLNELGVDGLKKLLALSAR